MMASPEQASPPDTASADMHPSLPSCSPPDSRPAQGSRSPTTAAPPEAAHPDHTAPTPTPEQASAEHSEADEPPPPPRLSLLPPEAAPAASPALEATSPVKPASPSPLPADVVVDVSPEVAASAPSPHPSTYPHTGEASPEDAPQPPLPPSTPPATTSSASPDPSTNEVAVMASQEAGRPPLAPESMDADSHTAPAPLTPPLYSGPEGLLPPLESGAGSSLQGPLPRSPPTMQAAPCSLDTAPPVSEKLTQLLLPSPPPVQTSHVLQGSAANGAVYVTSEEAPQPLPASESMDLDMDTAPALAPPLESEAGASLPPEPPLLPSHVEQHTSCSLGLLPSGFENVESSQLLPPAVVLPLDRAPDALADAGTKKTVTVEEVCHPLPVAGATEEANESILLPALENGCDGPLPHLEPQASSPAVHVAPTSPEIAPTGFENSESSRQTSPCLAETIDPSAHALAAMPVTVKSDKMSQPLSTDMENATLLQPPSKSDKRSLPQAEQRPSSPLVKDATCSPDIAPPGYEKLDCLEQPPSPPPSSKFEMGQMVCGCCRQLLAYPRGAVHVQCYGCSTINLVLEEHQVGKVYCGQCETLLMYPFGAPAVRCSTCLFVTEIGVRNVRPRVSMEQSASPHPQELTHQA